MGEQLVAPLGRIDLAARGKFAEPMGLKRGEQVRGFAPVIGKIADDPCYPLAQQGAQVDPFNRQPVHRPRGFVGKAQQPRWPGRLLTHRFAQQLGQPQPAPNRIAGRRDFGPRAQRIEQRAQRLVEIEIAHHRHAR